MQLPTTLKTGVLIVGAGPVGLTLQLLLSRMRIPSILAEANLLPRSHPRAHYLSNRSMEIWRQLGHLDKAMESIVEPLEYWRYFKYCRHIVDPYMNLYGVVDHFKDHYKYNGTYHDEYSPSKITNLPQHKLLFLLKSIGLNRSQIFRNDQDSVYLSWLIREYNLVMRNGGIDVEKRLKLSKLNRPFSIPEGCAEFKDQVLLDLPFLDGGLKFERFIDDAHGVLSELTRVRDGSKLHIKSAFVVGADGIHSKVRNHILKTECHTDVRDTANLENVMSVHFQSRQLADYTAYNPALMYFIFSRCICVLVCQGGDPPEFVVQIPYFPEIEPAELFDEDRCRNYLNEAVGTTLNDLNILKIKSWRVTTGVASTFVNKSGRVLIAGDAAHLVAPAGGLGMNMGISDAYNLAWRLGRVFYDRWLSLGVNSTTAILDDLIGSRLAESDMVSLNQYSNERRLVAEYTREVCLKEVENGSKFAKSLFYNHSVLRYFMDFLPTSNIFMGALDKIKDVMKHLYNTPKILHKIRKETHELFSNFHGALGLIFTGSDLAYAYVFSYRPELFEAYSVYRLSTVDLPSLMQPPIYHCFLVFSEETAQKLAQPNVNFAFVCLWETHKTYGNASTNTIQDEFLTEPLHIINQMGIDDSWRDLRGNKENWLIQDIPRTSSSSFIFYRAESDYADLDETLSYMSVMNRAVLIKRVFSNERVLAGFLDGLGCDIENLALVIRPDGHISELRRVKSGERL